jgi:hypothetical protein
MYIRKFFSPRNGITIVNVCISLSPPLNKNIDSNKIIIIIIIYYYYYDITALVCMSFLMCVAVVSFFLLVLTL